VECGGCGWADFKSPEALENAGVAGTRKREEKANGNRKDALRRLNAKLNAGIITWDWDLPK
jgi:hypothetical protein